MTLDPYNIINWFIVFYDQSTKIYSHAYRLVSSWQVNDLVSRRQLAEIDDTRAVGPTKEAIPIIIIIIFKAIPITQWAIIVLEQAHIY